MQKKQREVLTFVFTVVISMVVVYLLAGSGQWMESGRAAETSNDKAVIRGTIRDQQKPLYGIMVKAKAEGKNYTTTVFTDEQGEYVFPALPPGDYVVAVGAKWQEKVNLASSPVRKDFAVELGPAFINQTSGSSWFAMLPGTEAQKKTLFTNCSGCHSIWRLVDRPQISAEGWTTVIRLMATLPGPYRLDHLSEQDIQTLAKYLNDAVKPDLKERRVVEAMVRPRGEGAKAVFTEWDLPKEVGAGTGVKADSKGMIWFSAGRVKALGRLDTRTGNHQLFPVPPGNFEGEGPILHDVELDKEENVWVLGKNRIYKLDAKTFQYTSWDIPREYGSGAHTGVFTPDGNYWFTMREGRGWVGKLDPRNGKLTGYPPKAATRDDPNYRGPYGMVVDGKGAVWFTQIDVSKVAKIDPKTGELSEYPTLLSDAGPRRIKIDSKGNFWFTESFAVKIGKLEPKTMKFTDYDIGVPGGFPYFVLVDKADQVWFNLKNNNSIARLDPKTGKITHTPFPQPESATADPGLDLAADPPALVYSAQGPGIGRVYFRR